MQGMTATRERRQANLYAGRARHKGWLTGGCVISYDLPVSKPDFADVLQKNIDRWYESAEDFARKVRAATGTTLSASSVSRWCNRQSTPTVANIETMAPFIFDDRKRPIPVRRLVKIGRAHV